MFSKLWTYIKEGFTYSGLEITESKKGIGYSLLEIKKSKGELVIINKQELTTLKELIEVIPKKKPVFLCINTRNILTKKVNALHTKDANAILNFAFPNIDLSNFYYEIIQIDYEPIINITRKEGIDNLLKKLQDLKVKVFRFSLGVSSIENVVTYFEENTVQLSNLTIRLDDNGIQNIVQSETETKQSYTINGLELSSSYLLSFSAILSNLNYSIKITNFEEVTERLKLEFNNYRIFNEVLRLALTFFIVLLLGNFFVYNSYHQDVAQLNAAIVATSSKKDELSFLDASVKRKQERVETLSNSSNSKATFYLDLFAKNIPNSILLNEIKYQPLAKPVRDNKPILLEDGVLLVSGISKDVNEFSFWLSALEKYEWVSSAETLDYDYAGKTTSNFLIEIGFNEPNSSNFQKHEKQ